MSFCQRNPVEINNSTPCVTSDDECGNDTFNLSQNAAIDIQRKLRSFPMTSPVVSALMTESLTSVTSTVSSTIFSTTSTSTTSVHTLPISAASCSNLVPALSSSSLPKKANMGQVVSLLNQMIDRFDSMALQLNTISNSLSMAQTEIKQLKVSNLALVNEVTAVKSDNLKLKECVSHLQLHAREKFLILSGPKIKFQKETSEVQLRNELVKLLNDDYQINISLQNIASCRKFGGPKSKTQQILVELYCLEDKNKLFFQILNIKETRRQLYANEFLSEMQSQLLYNLRQLKKINPTKIFSTYSRNGKIYYKLEKTSNSNLVRSQNDIAQLENLMSAQNNLETSSH